MNGQKFPIVDGSSGKDLTKVKAQISPNMLSYFFPLFQQGITVEVETGCSIKELLCGQLGIDPAYVEERISTIFLNGKPVDDCDTAVVGDGAVLALSAAMPGLVGAMLRKGGFYTAMRSAITYRTQSADSIRAKGRIRLKLFNSIMGEAGPLILRRGIIIPNSNVIKLINETSAKILSGDMPTNGYNSTDADILLAVAIIAS
jgi:hypothetical protein